MTRTPGNHRENRSGSPRLLAGAALVALLGGIIAIVVTSGGGGLDGTRSVVVNEITVSAAG